MINWGRTHQMYYITQFCEGCEKEIRIWGAKGTVKEELVHIFLKWMMMVSNHYVIYILFDTFKRVL